MNRPGRLLAFDTSTERLAVALAADGRRFVHEAPGGALASQTLLPAVRALCAEAGVALAALQAVAFGRGPGAFTGLRTSCAVAQGLALGLGLPLVAVDSLAIVAEDAADALGEEATEVAVAMDARMDEVYAGRYRRTAPGRWQALEPPALMTLAALAASWQAAPPAVVAGSALTAFASDRLGVPAAARRVADETARAGALLRVAEAAFAAGETLDAADALPLYLRDKVALTTAEREAGRAAKDAAAAAAR